MYGQLAPQTPQHGPQCTIFCETQIGSSAVVGTISDRNDEFLDPLLNLSDTVRPGLVNFFLHVAHNKKKFSRLRSEEHVGQVESDIFDISVSGRRFSSHSIAIIEVWAWGHSYCTKRTVNENANGNFFQKMLQRLVALAFLCMIVLKPTPSDYDRPICVSQKMVH